jgi:cytochrome d ubiquinol oxidase subunit I
LSFQSYHLMATLGVLFIVLTLFSLLLLWRGKLFRSRWLLWVFVLAVCGPYLSNQAGWAAAEVGRQPWIVYRLLKTSDALSPAVHAGHVLGSILMFGVIYTMLFAVWVYVLHQKIRQGPISATDEEESTRGGLLAAAAQLAGHEGVSLTAAPDKPETPGRNPK